MRFKKVHFFGVLHPKKKKNRSRLRAWMSYGGDTWFWVEYTYMYEELKNYTCVWLISIWIII